MDLFDEISSRRELFQLRSQANRWTRNWFVEHGFLELETPILSGYSSLEPHIFPLTTTLSDDLGHQQNQFLRVSPELALKKVAASGYDRIFEMGKCFRNKEPKISKEHLCEFNLLEWYQKEQELSGLIDFFLEFVNQLFTKFRGSLQLEYLGGKYDLENWNIISVKQAFKQYAEIDFDQFTSWEVLIDIALERGQKRGQKSGREIDLDDAFYWLFLNEVEGKLRKTPTILYHYPEFQSSFSKLFVDRKSAGQLCYGLRFEAYLGGMEIANAFEELCDPEQQQSRWQDAQGWFARQNGEHRIKEVEYPIDKSFLHALERLNGTVMSGIAVGWDRLLMLLADVEEIGKMRVETF